jgi:glycosyltransferase involved in cell wall biosynthesis
MKAIAFIYARNEQEILPFTIKHYQNLCEKVVIVDNYSTDRTVKLAESMGCHVEKFGNPNFHDDYLLTVSKNNIWKNWKGYDWAIVCDADELLYITPQNLNFEFKFGTTILSTLGYNMHSRTWPKESLLEIKSGIYAKQYNKSLCFSPVRLEEIGFHPGCHWATPKGKLVYSVDQYPVLHYKFIGTPERMVNRHQMNSARSSQRNIEAGWGGHYHGDQSYLINQWDQWISQSEKIIE